MSEKTESYVRSEKVSNVAKLFLLYFSAPKTKRTFQARFKPKIFDPICQLKARTRPEKPGPTSEVVLWAYQMSVQNKLRLRSNAHDFTQSVDRPLRYTTLPLTSGYCLSHFESCLLI